MGLFQWLAPGAARVNRLCLAADATTLSDRYDAAHCMTGVIDGKGNSITCTRSPMGNKVSEQAGGSSSKRQRNITRVCGALNRIQQVIGTSNWGSRMLWCLLLAVGAAFPTANAAASQYSYVYQGTHGLFGSAAAACNDAGKVAIDGANVFSPVPPPGIPRALISALMIANGVCRIKYSATSEGGFYFTNEFDWAIDIAMPKPPRPEVELTSSNGQSCPAGVYAGNPIMPATGEKILAQADYAGEGFDALSMVRNYRSGGLIGPAAAASPAGLGQPWLHNHWAALRQDGTPGSADSTAQILFGDGTVRAFGWDAATGAWSATNGADTLVPGGAGLLYKRLDDDSLWQFGSTGKLLTTTQRSGWARTYSYSTAATPTAVAPVAGLLITVSNQFGRSLNFTYNTASQLVRVKTPDERTISYGYDGSTSSARLTTVTYPGGASRSYIYGVETPQLLTGIVDEKGNRYETLTYDSQGRGTSTQLAGGAELHTVSYGAGGTATVTDPLGTQRTYNYGSSKGKLAVLGADKPSGSGGSDAASRVQDANGFVTQEVDFLGINTMYTWDINRRLPLTTTRAAGLPEAQTTTTQWHASFRLPVLVTEAGRTTAYTYDAAGNPLTRTVTDTATSAARTTSWTYNAQGLLATEIARSGVVTRTNAYYSNTLFSGDPLPTAFDPNMDAVSLLLHADGANASTTFTDSSLSPKTLSVFGSASISTAQSKFGGSALYLNGGAGYLSTPFTTGFDVGRNDFTAETWYYTGSNTTDQALLTIANPSYASVIDFGLAIHHFSTSSTYSGKLLAVIYSGLNYYGVQSLNPLALNTWHHIAFVRKNGILSLYLNGVSQGSTNGNFAVNTSASGWTVAVGRHSVSAPRYVTGYLDDFRLTNGVARYSANFAPPASAFFNVGPINSNAVGHTAGDLQSITNAAGQTTQFTLYDRAGRVKQVVDAKGVVTDTSYTPRGWISSVTVTPPGGAARATSYTYDKAGQLTGVVLPDTTTMSYSYDAAHRLTGVTDAKGNSVIYSLDNMGNKAGEQVKDPSGNLQRSITRVYDALNRVQQTTGASN